MVQSLLLVNVGMELAMATVVIGSLYKNPSAEFSITDSESSWYGKNTIHHNLTQYNKTSEYRTLSVTEIVSVFSEGSVCSMFIVCFRKCIHYLEVFARVGFTAVVPKY